MAIEIVDFPTKHGHFPLQTVSLPEGTLPEMAMAFSFEAEFPRKYEKNSRPFTPKRLAARWPFETNKKNLSTDPHDVATIIVAILYQRLPIFSS